MRRHELTDEEWAIIAPLLPNKPRGVARVDDRRVINGILWRFRTGAPWRDVPERYGPRTTLYNRFVRWRAAGVWDKLLEAVSAAYDGDIVMIDSSCVRVAMVRPQCVRRGVAVDPDRLYAPRGELEQGRGAYAPSPTTTMSQV